MDYSTEQLFHGYFVSNPIFIDGSDRQRLTLGIQVSDYVLQKKCIEKLPLAWRHQPLLLHILLKKTEAE